MARASQRTYRLTHLVAERTLEFRGPGNAPQEVKVRLGLPRKAGRDWVCPYEILGLGASKKRWAFGVDAFQALTLAFHILPVELDAMARQAGGGDFLLFGAPNPRFTDGCSMLIDHIAALLSRAPVKPARRRAR